MGNYIEGKLVKIMEKITRKVESPGKKVVQKLVYLIQRKGVNLGFDYAIHYYGPYSSELDDFLYSLKIKGILDIVPDGNKHRIDFIGDEYGEYEEEELKISAVEETLIEEVLEYFGNKSGRELELITTVDFVKRKLGKNKCLANRDVIEAVQKIKSDKFSADEIERAIYVLEKHIN
ncbi:type II toxin-antitoxin system antitoxin SocA domain-containing protein [Thermosyntropha sp.]|uniref:type II toxin-antitoxin system antitoxin SocA domain-containing protein n=1 Tax=Thermosyntropha sp. TaxID=2740820 RepID=UPI0025F3CBC0|nr:type II toxin-antitoxin system antitoxin SocA domain-containing protein [Thermosyntropha sp.]MBO8159723.1 DUF4065 domain-containing protein [Thermosyntropha sp.]